jgi:hypothetical protein
MIKERFRFTRKPTLLNHHHRQTILKTLNQLFLNRHDSLSFPRSRQATAKPIPIGPHSYLSNMSYPSDLPDFRHLFVWHIKQTQLTLERYCLKKLNRIRPIPAPVSLNMPATLPHPTAFGDVDHPDNAPPHIPRRNAHLFHDPVTILRAQQLHHRVERAHVKRFPRVN